MVYRSIPRIYHLRSRSEEISSFDKPPSEVRGLSKLQTSDDLDRVWYIHEIDCINHGSYVICHSDDIVRACASAEAQRGAILGARDVRT